MRKRLKKLAEKVGVPEVVIENGSEDDIITFISATIAHYRESGFPAAEAEEKLKEITKE